MAGERTRERGELEAEILRILRSAEAPMSAREIRAEFTGHVPAATTLMTVLVRLQQKGEVLRSGESPRKSVFAAARTGDEHASHSMLSALASAGDRQAALLRFAGNLSADDVDLLRRAIEPRAPRRGSGDA